jgi:hypothetical protein
MIRIPFGPLSFVLACALSFPAVLRADGQPEGAVTGNGRVDIKRQPELLRMQLTVTADGKDIVEAVAKLKEAQTAAGKKLAELGAVEKSVELGPIQVGGNVVGDPRQQYIERMRGNLGAAKAQKQSPQLVTVASTLKAEWSLKAGTPEELLIAGYTLQEKIKAASAGKKQAKALTPEEQEVLDEAQGMMQGQPNPGDPTFQFIARVSAEDRPSRWPRPSRKPRRMPPAWRKPPARNLAPYVTSAEAKAPRSKMSNTCGNTASRCPVRRNPRPAKPAPRIPVRWSSM